MRKHFMLIPLCLVAVAVIGGVYLCEPDFETFITVQDLGGDEWRVEYKFSHPVQAVRFLRQRNQFRQKKWIVKSPHIMLHLIDGKEHLASKEMFKKVVVRFKTDDDHLPADYDFFRRFTDGSRSLYTGYLNVVPLPQGARLRDEDRIVKTHFIFKSSRNTHIALFGKSYLRAAKWLDQENEGTYVYFGNIEPLETANVLAVVDPGLPRWIWSQTEALLPRIFHYYAERLDAKLSSKPLVLFNYKDPLTHWKGSGGDVLTGLVHFQLEGDAWKEESEEKRTIIAKMLSHESFHLWNGSEFYYEGEGGHQWMHEGGSDAIALRALAQLKLINREELLSMYSEQLNGCLFELRRAPLRKASVTDSRIFYDCGATIGLLSALLIQQKNSKADLFDLWREIFREARRNKNIYTKESYFRSLEKLSQNGEKVNILKSLIEKHLVDPVPTFAQLLNELGAEVRELPLDAPESLQREWGLEAMNLLMEQDCQGHRSYYIRKDHLKVKGTSECENLRSEVEIARIDNIPLLQRGGVAYDRLYQLCEARKMVPLGIYKSSKALQIRCNEPILKRIPPLKIIKLKS